MKRILSIVLAMVIAMGLFAGLAMAEAPFVPRLDTEMAAEFSIIGHLSNFEALEAVITEFTKYYPNVTIAYEKMGNYYDMLDTRLENDPDVGCFLDGTTEYSVELLAEGIDVGEFSAVINSGMHEDGLYSVPLGIDVSGFVINVDLFAREGIAVPTNYGEFCAVCDQFVAKGYTPIQQHSTAVADYIFSNQMWAIIDSAEDQEAFIAMLSSGEVGSYECMRPLYEMAESFFAKGYTSREVNAGIANNYEAAILNFFEGDVPFMPANVDTVSGMKKREGKSEAFTANPFTYRFIYVPLAENGVYAEQGAWRLLSVNKNADNKDLAVEFMRFLCRRENLNLLAEVKGLPSASCAPTDPRFESLNDVQGVTVYKWTHKIKAVLTNSVIGRLKEYCLGDIATIDEALRMIEEDVVK